MKHRISRGSPVLAFACTLLLAAPQIAVADGASWKMGGQNTFNARSQDDEKKIRVANVDRLTTKWVVATDGDVSATPAVADGALYIPDWAGKLYKLNAKTGAQIWKITLPAVSRATPAVVGNRLIVPLLGLPPGGTCAGVSGGACVLSIDARTGAIIWQSRIDAFPTAYVTQAPVVEDRHVYVGVTSAEESLAGFVPGYPCCAFRGSIVALDLDTGAILWKTADPNLLSGAYGPVTVANGVVFAGSNGGPSPLFTGGTVPWDHRSAPTMFALDANTGAVKWTHVAGGSVLGGAAVVDGMVYWGSGYANFGVGVDNKKLFAFALQ